MNYKYLLIISLILVSCKKKENLPIFVIGHAGAGLEFSGSVYHGNSEEAMDYALNMPNCDGVEMDLRMAADGTLWLSHDQTLDIETKASGCVGDKLSDELINIQYSTLKKEKLAQLSDIEIFREGDQKLFVDVKHFNFCQNSIQDVSLFLSSLNSWRATISNSNDRIQLIISNADWIEAFQLAGWNVLFSTDDAELRKQLSFDYPNLKGFVCKNGECSKNQVDEIKSAGKAIYLYEVRSPKALKQVREKNPTGVMSDDLQGAIVEFK
jgi:glycerophosphoryl diester phosphodiesterase|tara:strand:+ start:24209 stop:25009 length:801 start_codon:yes stop_codon:yes gene_type:complete